MQSMVEGPPIAGWRPLRLASLATSPACGGGTIAAIVQIRRVCRGPTVLPVLSNSPTIRRSRGSTALGKVAASAPQGRGRL